MSATKHDKGKPRMSLIPFLPMQEVAHVLTHGATVHSDHNWRGGFNVSRLLDAAERHIGKWRDVQHADEETGRSHLAHAICELLFALNQELTGTGVDDSWVGICEDSRNGIIRQPPSFEVGQSINLLQEEDEYTKDIGPITL